MNKSKMALLISVGILFMFSIGMLIVIYVKSDPQPGLDMISSELSSSRESTNGIYAFCMTNGVLKQLDSIRSGGTTEQLLELERIHSESDGTYGLIPIYRWQSEGLIEVQDRPFKIRDLSNINEFLKDDINIQDEYWDGIIETDLYRIYDIVKIVDDKAMFYFENGKNCPVMFNVEKKLALPERYITEDIKDIDIFSTEEVITLVRLEDGSFYTFSANLHRDSIFDTWQGETQNKPFFAMHILIDAKYLDVPDDFILDFYQEKAKTMYVTELRENEREINSEIVESYSAQ